MARDNEHPALRGVDAREAAKNTQVEEYYAAQEGLQPTPTQRENDLAKVGAHDLDNKEDDGSEWEDDAHTRVMTARLPQNNPYDTRQIDASAEREGSAPRRAGRPKKSAE